RCARCPRRAQRPVRRRCPFRGLGGRRTVMTQVLLAVDFEFDLILFELLSDIDDVTIVARPADEVELLAHCRTGSADVVIVGRYFPGLDAEVVSAITATGAKVLGFGDDAEAMSALGIAASVGTDADAAMLATALETSETRPSSRPDPRLRRGRSAVRGGSSRCGGRDRRRDGPSRRSTSPTRPVGRATAAC